MGGGLILVAMVIAHAAVGGLVQPLRLDPARHHARLRRDRLLRRLFETGGRQFEGPGGALQVSGAVARRPVHRVQPAQHASIDVGDFAVRAVLQDRGGAHDHGRVRRLRLLRHRRHQQCRESHRRARRPRHHAGGDGGGGARRVRLCHGQFQVRDLSADSLHHRRGRGARFSARRLSARDSAFCGSTPTRPRCSWAMWARWPSAPRSARSP